MLSFPLEKIKQLYEGNFPYLEITEQGKSELYVSKQVVENAGTMHKKSRLKK